MTTELLGANAAYITFSAEINTSTTESLLAVLAQAVTEGYEEVHLLLSTQGGSVMSGMNLYNVMRGLPYHLITHNVGNVDSIGNVVFLAGKQRYACPQTTFTFHGVLYDTGQREIQEERLLQTRLDSVRREHDRIGAIVAERTEISQERAAGFFAEAETINAADAVGLGIVHEIRPITIPAGAAIAALTFAR